MENWQKDFIKVASKIKEEFDQQKFQLKEKLSLVSPVTIQAYRGFAGKDGLFIRGRVLENEGLDLPPQNASVWQNIRSLYHRFESDEIPFAPIEINLNEFSQQLRCDKEGFFELNISKDQMPPFTKEQWQKIFFSLLASYNKNQQDVKTESEILIQQANNSFGVISDVDDTIIVTHATAFLEKMQVFLLRNSHTRKPLEGVAAFYRSLERGKEGNCQNPFFYISGSSWNLYEVLDSFCNINNIPKGAFLLQELGINPDKLLKKSHHHKLSNIQKVLNSFTDLPFVLIGDSGQKDPEIYQEVVNQFPGRIKVIYIRDVKPSISDNRDREVQQIAEMVGKKGVEMKLIQDSCDAAEHALNLGLIPADAIEEIQEETNKDKSRPSDISQLLVLDKFL